MIFKTDKRIRELRENRGITQAELARHIGVTRASVNTWEMGMYVPSVDRLADLAQFFHTTTDYILGLDDREFIDISEFGYDEKELLNRLISYYDKMKNSHEEKD